MPKSTITLLMLMLCSTALADPLGFSCERLAWKNTRDCAVNDTYEVYVYYVDSEEFTSDQQANKKSYRYEKPKSIFTVFKGCGSGKTSTYNGRFTANDEMATFSTQYRSARIRISLDDMTATLIPTKHGNTLKCEKLEGVTAGEYALLKEDARNAVSQTTAGAYFY